MVVLRWIRRIVVGLFLAVGAVIFGASLGDGPRVELLAGGPFRSGELVEGDVPDWGFASGLETIELQSGTPPRSRKVGVLVLDGGAYVPCSLSFPPFKTWHEQALEDPAAVVRIEGRRYRRRLHRVTDPALQERLFASVESKYGGAPGTGPEDMWYFRLEPPGRLVP